MSGRYGRVTMVWVATLLTGCVSSQGVRKLEEVERKYFEALNQELVGSQQPIDEVLGLAARSDAQAIREVASFENRIANARRIYSLREMLTAPKGDSAEFVQVTRNKVLLYHLVEAVEAENQRVAALVAEGDAQRKQLSYLYGEVVLHTGRVLDTQRALQQYLNQPLPQHFSDSVMEVGRQLAAFNDEIQKADERGSIPPGLTELGQEAGKRVEQVNAGLDKFIELWPRLNTLKEK